MAELYVAFMFLLGIMLSVVCVYFFRKIVDYVHTHSNFVVKKTSSKA